MYLAEQFELTSFFSYSDFAEFVTAMSKRKMQSGEQECDDPVKAKFAEWDKDGDGFIGASDLKEAVRMTSGEKLSDEEVDEMMREADIDGDGKLSLREFMRMMTD